MNNINLLASVKPQFSEMAANLQIPEGLRKDGKRLEKWVCSKDTGEQICS
jgi:hypothetical protein